MIWRKLCERSCTNSALRFTNSVRHSERSFLLLGLIITVQNSDYIFYELL